MKNVDLFYETQQHLTKNETVMLGSYYTPKHIIELAYNLIHKYIPNYKEYTALDSSAGYGNFLTNSIFQRQITGEIDNFALSVLQNNKAIETYKKNALHNVSRKNYNLNDNEKLLIIGNPPYNDTTSHAKKEIKKDSELYEIDFDIKARDVGCSFLMSYNKLQADYVCVLHPLSYLIKKANFNLLKTFKDNYQLIDGLVFSSQEFNKTSKNSQFPIIIGLYKKNSVGMNFEYITKYKFRTIDGKEFSLNNFDYIENYISKYPNKSNSSNILFWTMRDINALRRNKTFIKNSCANAVCVDRESLAYYCYVDIFKKFTKHIPYYFGNLSIPIDNKNFTALKDDFTNYSLQNYDFLKQHSSGNKFSLAKIEGYFQNLFSNHYVY